MEIKEGMNERLLNDLEKIDKVLPYSWNLESEEGRKLVKQFRKKLKISRII